ncbi:unnamed protein product [Rotaria sp. Silwood1]|nr:unnamed protein product [Rotaria sp. Silwood1]
MDANIFPNRQPVQSPVSTSRAGSSASSARRTLSSNEDEDGFTTVKSKKKKNRNESFDQSSPSRQVITTSLSPTNMSNDQVITQSTNIVQHPLAMQPVPVTNESTRYALTPFQVLVCSKCSGIGHFRNQCTQIQTTCKICCDLIDNPNQHTCSNIIKCAHCGNNHKSTSSTCPVIKAYRADLTRKILHPVPAPSDSSLINSNTNFISILRNPHQQASQPPTNNIMMEKLDDLIHKLSDVKDHLSSLSLKYEKFEQFMIEKNQSDQTLKLNLNSLSQTTNDLKHDVIYYRSKIDRQEKIISKLMVPMFTDLFQVFISQMSDVLDVTIYTNLKQKLEHYLIQMQKAREGENRNGGVLILVRAEYQVKRVVCDLPNVCVLDFVGEDELRICGVYAPDSKSWKWDNLTIYLAKKTVIFGDFNVDLNQDSTKAESLLSWADNQFLAPFTPDAPTSMRSNRVIDYALACGISIDIQNFNETRSGEKCSLEGLLSFH